MKTKKQIFLLIVLSISLSAFSFVEIDQGYIKAFGWGSICVSKAGYPEIGSYNASQFEYKDGKFFVEAGGSISLRAILPEGRTYGDLLKAYNENHKEFKKMTEEQIYWKIYSDHDVVGNVLFKEWPSNPEEMLHQNKPLCTMQFTTEGAVKSWKSSGVDWAETNNNDMQRDVGNWLASAKPGWQLYILHTVGFQRNCPENKYYDYGQGKEVIPIAYEMAKPFAYSIVEVK